MDFSPERVGTFDIVLFLGVLYHLRHPLSGLERVASITDEMLILDTHVDLLLNRRAAMALYPETEFNGDPTNWCGPNPAGVIALLKMAGFGKVEIVSRQFTPLHRLARSFKRRFVNGESFLQTLAQDRMVFHAWK